uniref:Genome polyprotein n=1 Tax=Henbane mosaic virus TaxID=369762 RepID=A0A3S5HKX3_9POTV|nr:polyprotein [Henbane mosaic virus]
MAALVFGAIDYNNYLSNLSESDFHSEALSISGQASAEIFSTYGIVGTLTLPPPVKVVQQVPCTETVRETVKVVYCRCHSCNDEMPSKSFYMKHLKSRCDTFAPESLFKFEERDVTHSYWKSVEVEVAPAPQIPITEKSAIVPKAQSIQQQVEAPTIAETHTIPTQQTEQLNTSTQGVQTVQEVVPPTYREQLLVAPKRAIISIDSYNQWSDEQVLDFSLAQDIAFADLERNLPNRAPLTGGRFVYTKRGSSAYKMYTRKQRSDMKKKATKQTAWVAKDIWAAVPQLCMVNRISIAGGVSPSSATGEPTEVTRGKVHALSKRRASRARPNICTINEQQWDQLLSACTAPHDSPSRTIEVIGRRNRRIAAQVHKHKSANFLKVNTFHEQGLYKNYDIIIHPTIQSLVNQLAKVCTKNLRMHESRVQPGMSGFIFPVDSLHGHRYHTHNDAFIVRGRHEDLLFDAQSYTPTSMLYDMRYYSFAEKFWEGYDNEFRANRASPTTHDNVRKLDVGACGGVSAIIHQALLPCCRITCTTCAEILSTSSDREIQARIVQSAKRGEEMISSKYPEFEHVKQLLGMHARLLSSTNENREAVGKVQFLIGERTDEPFISVNKINEVLLKGSRATTADFSRASDHLLELARYLKNRTENIQKGSLRSFRNKASGKAHLNPTLMCDNQLDANGNFVWGKRGYHAKRFFENFFDVIEPTRGYDAFIERKHPHGTRKLAIGNLIISTNLEAQRKQLEGEPIERMDLTDACVSRRHETFIYPCCCVTYDDGTPVLSDVKTPTKNHLVLGNTGDSKFLDLPTEISDKLYIAKAGFCYINIFLAMLVNVDEVDAKNFTKWVRDVVVTQLKEWPTMSDVALACHQLSILFPATASAELPRILVDHKTKTMHVIDSFGSITTGYHVLKANTVSQIIKFASETLESEMKHYQVGGIPDNDVEIKRSGLRTLIQAVYKPKLMRQIIEEDPYFLVLALFSPSILIALYKNGALYQATIGQPTQSMSARTIVNLLTVLAGKVSRCELFAEQVSIIENNLHDFQLVLSTGDRCSVARALLARMVDAHITTVEVDWELDTLGYRRTRNRAWAQEEKIYAQDLELAWRELGLLEKLSCLRVQLKWRKLIIATVTRANSISFASGLQECKDYLLEQTPAVQSAYNYCKISTKRTKLWVRKRIMDRLIRSFVHFIPDIQSCFSLVTIVYMFVYIIRTIADTRKLFVQNQILAKEADGDEKMRQLEMLHLVLKVRLGQNPTMEEFITFLQETNPALIEFFMGYSGKEVKHQAVKRESEARLEQVVAIIALLMMVFDNERSDCVYRVMNKLKTVVSVADQNVVAHQSLDEMIPNLDEEWKELVNIDLTTPENLGLTHASTTFGKWWDHQITTNRVIPHYRTEGHFMEFTRDTCASVANKIAHSDITDILLRGAVGSGKSTGLPAELSKRGRVLVVEPTRPLAQNVQVQLRQAPFTLNPTLMMRGLTSYGSTPITIMTSGYAFFYLANNTGKIHEFQYIIIDECHVLDANAMALRSLLEEHAYKGKVIKVSATPPGREVEFTTQYPVKLRTEASLSFQQFVDAQGTGSNADISSVADNILVYVASYNEVDSLSKSLLNKGFQVTKVDGRTMKNASTSIKTLGTPSRKHFVVATNIIENGVTLDIDAVVDFGMKVSPYLDIDMRAIAYSKVGINYGERIQRLGRVGRVKPGHALRIGSTSKGLEAIPSMVATEAAFLCFIYGLPVMTSMVSVGFLKHCTVQQAKTMKLFELPTFFMLDLVHYDGTMHPAIHSLLCKYKLHECEMQLNKRALPYACLSQWLTSKEYNQCSKKLPFEENMKLPFYVNDVPDALYEKLWQTVQNHKGDASFGRVTTANAARIAYTLRTDTNSIQRTVAIIDHLIESEMKKKSHFDSLVTNAVSTSSFSLIGTANMLRSRYATDYTAENLSVLQAAKAQLLEFSNTCLHQVESGELSESRLRDCVQPLGAMETVMHQSKEELSKFLGLKGKWNKTLVTKDILVCLGVAGGAAWMAYEYFKTEVNDDVAHQGKSKRTRQKLKFRDAADEKVGRVAFDDNSGAIEHFFGAAYTQKGKSKGKTHAMGKKTRRFVNMYGFDPTEYSYIRFVDPVTGEMIDESVMADIILVQEHFNDLRHQYIDENKIDAEVLKKQPGISAYFVKDKTTPVLKVDLTGHVPLKVCDRHSTIAGFPEYEGVLRQTNLPEQLKYSELPESEVEHEAKSMIRGIRDYNHISKSVCLLVNESEGHLLTIHGIGFGAYIVTNRHLFRRNSGTLTLRTMHGEFIVQDIRKLQMAPIKNRDMLLIKLPKDCPPFPTKLKFREPDSSDLVLMIGNNFQDKFISSMTSGMSATTKVERSEFWRHWIDTKDGHCGLPLVANKDGAIVGIHSLANTRNDKNYFTAVPDDLMATLTDPKSIEWTSNWLYNPDEIGWGPLHLKASAPTGLFETHKEILSLFNNLVTEQASEGWLYSQLHCNLKAVAFSESQLVTKHIVKGQCQLFQLYLSEHPEAKEFFKPLMGHYGKSRLNKIAYAKDILKYASPIEIGTVSTSHFETSIINVKSILEKVGFKECAYVTDPDEIYGNLNMKASVGALYKGKKREFIETLSEQDKDELIKQSCLRLYTGKMGVWNGSIKAELRPQEKLLANKTRTFTAAPIDTLLGGKVCVDDFNNQFYSLHTKAPWSVGMSKFSQGWHNLFEKLPEGWVYCDADGSRFDSSLTPYLINAVLNIRLHFMEEWEVGVQMLRNLYAEIIYTPILTADGTIVKKFKGNNSGQPSTVVDNTLMVLLAVQYSLLRSGYALDKQEEMCVYFANGDDLVIAVHPQHTQFLDTCQEYFKELGLSYDFSSRTSNKTELWFMSHQCMPRDGILIPKLEQERVVSILEWDRADKPEHRLEAICASMIEAWGHTELLHQIRVFYAWVLEQAPYNELAREGKAPYISESALKNLYTSVGPEPSELEVYLRSLMLAPVDDEWPEVYHQADSKIVDAGAPIKQVDKNPVKAPATSTQEPVPDRDVNAGTSGTFSVPRHKGLSSKMSLPKVSGNAIVNLEHLLQYKPDQTRISNTRATDSQFKAWYDHVMNEYEVDESGMSILMNGLMVWCIENGTSPNINGVWIMMDGDEQVEYPIKPLIDHAKPSFRQIMAHFSNLAEAYIEKQNFERPYMPRYGLQRNLTDMSLARYAFDFYEMTSKTPARAREAHIQMKAAALRSTTNRLFGLDGRVGTTEEDTERHTADDVNRNMHTLLGVRQM